MFDDASIIFFPDHTLSVVSVVNHIDSNTYDIYIQFSVEEQNTSQWDKNWKIVQKKSVEGLHHN